MYVLDTNVISELRKVTKGKADRNVARLAARVAPTTLFLSVITILELDRGVLLRERRDPLQGTLLRNWLETQVVPAFAGRMLPVDLAIARFCAYLRVPDPMEERDALSAATAMVHGMTFVTRNVGHFKRAGVAIFNPWLA